MQTLPAVAEAMQATKMIQHCSMDNMIVGGGGVVASVPLAPAATTVRSIKA